MRYPSDLTGFGRAAINSIMLVDVIPVCKITGKAGDRLKIWLTGEISWNRNSWYETSCQVFTGDGPPYGRDGIIPSSIIHLSAHVGGGAARTIPVTSLTVRFASRIRIHGRKSWVSRYRGRPLTSIVLSTLSP